MDTKIHLDRYLENLHKECVYSTIVPIPNIYEEDFYPILEYLFDFNKCLSYLKDWVKNHSDLISYIEKVEENEKSPAGKYLLRLYSSALKKVNLISHLSSDQILTRIPCPVDEKYFKGLRYEEIPEEFDSVLGDNEKLFESLNKGLKWIVGVGLLCEWLLEVQTEKLENDFYTNLSLKGLNWSE